MIDLPTKERLQANDDYLRVSYSSLNLFSGCARKFEFTKLYPRRARDYDNFAADVGTSLHRGYQNYLEFQDDDRALWALLESYPYELAWDQEKDERSLEAAVITLEAMIASADMNAWEVAKIIKPAPTPENPLATATVAAIEVPFELRLKGITLPDGRGIAITGFIDAILKNRHMDYFRTTDIKTHRRWAKDLGQKARMDTAKYKYDTQQVPYGIVLEHIQGLPVDRFEVMYLDTFIDVAEPQISLYPFWKDQQDVQEWLMNTVLKCQQIQRFMEMDYFPRTDGGCLSWQKPCYYMEPCQSRNRTAIEAWFLEGQTPKHPEYTTPWILGEIDPFGGGES